MPESIPAGDGAEGPQSTLRLFENDLELGPAHSLHDHIRTDGGGLFSHWNDSLYLSTSDGSDPRTNRRVYSAVFGSGHKDDTAPPPLPEVCEPPPPVEGEDGPPFRLHPIRKAEGYAWAVALPDLTAESDSPMGSANSRIVVFEDDRPLGPAHSIHDDIRQFGRGRYSHWGDSLLFSTGDNSDPRTNGRVYTAQIRATPMVPAFPDTLHLNLTTACNLNCQICRPPEFSRSHIVRNLADDQLDHVIAEVFPHLTSLRVDSSGEPLTSRNFRKVIEAASAIGLPVHVQTNGMLLRQDMADFIAGSSVRSLCISLDSPHKQTLEWLRTGADFDRIMKGVSRLVAVRGRHGRDRDLTLQFHGALLVQNRDHVTDLVDLAGRMGVNGVSLAYGFIHAYMDPDWSVFWDRELTNRRMEEAQAQALRHSVFFNPPPPFDMSASEMEAGRNSLALAGSKACQYLYGWSYIDPSGKVHPCCVGNYVLGNLGASSFKEIWDGDLYRELRRTHQTASPSYGKCANCYLRAGWQPNDNKALFAPEHWPHVEARLAKSRNRQ